MGVEAKNSMNGMVKSLKETGQVWHKELKSTWEKSREMSKKQFGQIKEGAAKAGKNVVDKVQNLMKKANLNAMGWPRVRWLLADCMCFG